MVKGLPRLEGANATPPSLHPPHPKQELRLQLKSSQAVAARLREQLSERQQELRASRRLLQEREQDGGDLLDRLEAQSQKAQHCRAASELLERWLA